MGLQLYYQLEPTHNHTHTLFKTKCTTSPITIGFRQEPMNKNAIQNRTETLLMDQQGLTAGPIEVRGINQGRTRGLGLSLPGSTGPGSPGQ